MLREIFEERRREQALEARREKASPDYARAKAERLLTTGKPRVIAGALALAGALSFIAANIHEYNNVETDPQAVNEVIQTRLIPGCTDYLAQANSKTPVDSEIRACVEQATPEAIDQIRNSAMVNGGLMTVAALACLFYMGTGARNVRAARRTLAGLNGPR